MNGDCGIDWKDFDPEKHQVLDRDPNAGVFIEIGLNDSSLTNCALVYGTVGRETYRAVIAPRRDSRGHVPFIADDLVRRKKLYGRSDE